MKNKKNGFLLVETLIVSTFIAVVLIYIFVQFKILTDNYARSFQFNTAKSLYAAEAFRTFIVNKNLKTSVITKIQGNVNDTSLNFKDCNTTVGIDNPNQSYCRNLVSKLEINKVIILKASTLGMVDYNGVASLTNNQKSFINQLVKGADNEYYMITILTNYEIGAVKLK